MMPPAQKLDGSINLVCEVDDGIVAACGAAFMYTLVVTAKLNDIDPQAWLADILARMPNMPVSRLPELLPWSLVAERNRKRDAA